MKSIIYLYLLIEKSEQHPQNCIRKIILCFIILLFQCFCIFLINPSQITTTVFSCIRVYRIIVATFMRNTPSIYPSHDFAIYCSSSLQCCIAITHDCLTDVVKTMVDMFCRYWVVVEGKRQIFPIVFASVPVLK